jgi:hypothetical protein
MHRRFIFCGTVRSQFLASLARIEKAAPWRYQARRPLVPAQRAETLVPTTLREDHGVRTFLPASLLAKKGPAITRLARQGKYIIFVAVVESVLARQFPSIDMEN